MWQSTGEGGGQRDNIRGLKNIEKGRKKRVSLSLRTHTQSASLGLAVSWPTMVSVVVAADGTRKKRGIFKLHLHPNPWPLVVMVAFVAEEKKTPSIQGYRRKESVCGPGGNSRIFSRFFLGRCRVSPDGLVVV